MPGGRNRFCGGTEGSLSLTQLCSSARPGQRSGSRNRYHDADRHAAKAQLALPKIEGIDPELILKVRLRAPIQEDTWRTAGFKVLAQEPGGILLLFTDGMEVEGVP